MTTEMPFTAEEIADIVDRVRPMMKSDTRHVSQVFDLRDDEDESLTAIGLECMAIDVVIGRCATAKARARVSMFTDQPTAELPYQIQAVLDACEFVEAELA
jgi:hypothetical protein